MIPWRPMDHMIAPPFTRQLRPRAVKIFAPSTGEMAQWVNACFKHEVALWVPSTLIKTKLVYVCNPELEDRQVGFEASLAK